MSKKDMIGDCRVNHLLQDKIEDDFYDNLPVKFEGQTLSNKDAGLKVDKYKKTVLNNEK